MLILSPTRELAVQSQKVCFWRLDPNDPHSQHARQVLLALGDFMNVQVHACIGGKSVGEDVRKLDNGVHVVSGTVRSLLLV